MWSKNFCIWTEIVCFAPHGTRPRGLLWGLNGMMLYKILPQFWTYNSLSIDGRFCIKRTESNRHLFSFEFMSRDKLSCILCGRDHVYGVPFCSELGDLRGHLDKRKGWKWVAERAGMRGLTWRSDAHLQVFKREWSYSPQLWKAESGPNPWKL